MAMQLIECVCRTLSEGRRPEVIEKNSWIVLWDKRGGIPS